MRAGAGARSRNRVGGMEGAGENGRREKPTRASEDRGCQETHEERRERERDHRNKRVKKERARRGATGESESE